MQIETFLLRPTDRAPNSRLPLVIYRGAFEGSIDAFEGRLRAHGWPPDWHNTIGMYPKHHFHSDAHELIAVSRGALAGQFGGHDGVRTQLNTGDVVVIPAGVAHLGTAVSGDLRITGCFPEGQAIHDFRLCYPSELDETLRRSRRVPVPPRDPVLGGRGPIQELWEGQ